MQGLGSPGGPGMIFVCALELVVTNSAIQENPVWTLAKKWDLTNTYSNYSSILTYNETGYTDYTSLMNEYSNRYAIAAEQAGVLLKENLQDQTVRTGLSLAGWKPKVDDMARQAVEWWNWGGFLSLHLGIHFLISHRLGGCLLAG